MDELDCPADLEDAFEDADALVSTSLPDEALVRLFRLLALFRPRLGLGHGAESSEELAELDRRSSEWRVFSSSRGSSLSLSGAWLADDASSGRPELPEALEDLDDGALDELDDAEALEEVLPSDELSLGGFRFRCLT